MTRRCMPGPFTARRLDGGVWQLTEIKPGGAEIFLRGTDAAELSNDGTIETVEVEWRLDDVRISLTAARGARSLAVDSATVHEPQTRLYEALPLAGFDSDARRFWQRVFRLMRIPGGRLVLKYVARRNPRPRSGAL